MRRDAKIISEPFKRFVKEQRCISWATNCAGPTDPHHLVAEGWRKAKRNDLTCVPLCRGHHGEIEQIGVDKFEAKYAVNVWKENSWLQMEFFADPDCSKIETESNCGVVRRKR